MPTKPASMVEIYGWFDDPKKAAASDPPHDAPCMICGKPVHANDVRTISIMMPQTAPFRSYFYRLHRTCHAPLSEHRRREIDAVVWDAIRHYRD